MTILNNPMGALQALNSSTSSVSLISKGTRLAFGSPQGQGGDEGGGGGGGSKGCDWDKGKKACDAYMKACGDRCRDKGGVDVVACAYSCDGSTSDQSCRCINEPYAGSDLSEILNPANM